MRIRQVAIEMQDLAAMGSGFFVKQYLRGHGLNPEGNIQRARQTKDEVEYMIYTEILDDERPKEIGTMEKVEGRILDQRGEVCTQRPVEDVRV